MDILESLTQKRRVEGQIMDHVLGVLQSKYFTPDNMRLRTIDSPTKILRGFRGIQRLLFKV
ncbi:hypothetical protein D1872_347770 [compost metagenome]